MGFLITSSSILHLLLGTNILLSCCGFRGQLYHPTRNDRNTGRKSSILPVMASEILDSCTMTNDISTKKFLIHWRGEKDVGYSKPFRRLEFENALAAEIESLTTSQKITALHLPDIHFQNALNYTGNETMTDILGKNIRNAIQNIIVVFVICSYVGWH